MPLASVEQRQFGLKKEVVRGTPEASPAKWYPVLSDSEFKYELQHLEDMALRGVPEMFVPVPGVKAGTAKIKMPLDAQTIGEFLVSLLGSVTSVQQGATPAYKHTFTRLNNLQKPVYTFFFDRGLSVKAYALSGVKKLTLQGPVDNLIMAEVDALFKSESPGAIGTPAFPTQKYLSFQHTTFKIDGVQNLNVKTWNLSIDNNALAYRTISTSQDIVDVLTPGRLKISGGFTIFFQDEVQRNKFLNNTSLSLQMLVEGETISAPHKYTVDVSLPEVRYTAFPYGEDSGLLAAQAEFEAFFNTGQNKAVQVDVTNTDTGY